MLVLPVRTNNNSFVCKKEFNKPQFRPEIKQDKICSDRISFSGNIGGYLNKEIYQQSQSFQKGTFFLLMSDNSFAKNFGNVIKGVFKDFKFELKDIKTVNYPDIIKNRPTIFSKTNFMAKEPITTLYIDFDKINGIKHSAANPQEGFINCISEMEKSILENNELNLISNIADDLTNILNKTKTINLSSTEKAINEIMSKYKLDVNFSVFDKKTLPHNDVVFKHSLSVENQQLFSALGINFLAQRKVLIPGIVHEFIHSLCSNSVTFNYMYGKMFKDYGAFRNLLPALGFKFKEIDASNPSFLKMPREQRQMKYNEILKSILKQGDEDTFKGQIDVLENYIKGEVFTNSNTTKLYNVYGKKTEAPYASYFNDLLEYILSIKYNALKRKDFFN